jgi:hypothetical protein
MTYRLLPPHWYMHNADERAVSNFKEHFVEGLSSVDLDLPVHLWDLLLPQLEITLNLLRTLRLHPQLSTAAHFNGLIDYNKTSFAPPRFKIIAHDNKTAFAPPRCTIIAHEKPSQRRCWAPRGYPGYSLGPSIHHYRCQNVYITSTSSKRIVDTLEFSPHNSTMPQLSSTDRLLMAANDIMDAFKHPHPDVPLNTVGDNTITALTTLAAIFKRKYNNIPALNLRDSTIKSA